MTPIVSGRGDVSRLGACRKTRSAAGFGGRAPRRDARFSKGRLTSLAVIGPIADSPPLDQRLRKQTWIWQLSNSNPWLGARGEGGPGPFLSAHQLLSLSLYHADHGLKDEVERWVCDASKGFLCALPKLHRLPKVVLPNFTEELRE
jgi:hypothetical protein